MHNDLTSSDDCKAIFAMSGCNDSDASPKISPKQNGYSMHVTGEVSVSNANLFLCCSDYSQL